MAERLNAHAWKACLLVRVTGVRIPLCPPFTKEHPLWGSFVNDEDERI